MESFDRDIVLIIRGEKVGPVSPIPVEVAVTRFGRIEAAWDQATEGHKSFDPDEDGYPVVEIHLPYVSLDTLREMDRIYELRGEKLSALDGGGSRWEKLWHCPPPWERFFKFLQHVLDQPTGAAK